MAIIEEYMLDHSKVKIADDYIETEKEMEIWKEVCKIGQHFLEKERESE